MVQLSRATAVNFRLGRAPRPVDAKITVAECSRFSTAVLCAELLKPALSLDERAIHVPAMYSSCTAMHGAGGAVRRWPSAHPAAAPRTDGDTIVIQSLPPRPSWYGGWDGGRFEGGCHAAAAAVAIAAAVAVAAAIAAAAAAGRDGPFGLVSGL